MSKKSGKGKKSKNTEEIDLILEATESETTNAAMDLGYLVNAILDYYADTGAQALEEGDEWKVGTEYAPKPNSTIPEDLDAEIKKAFIAQIKKFQK